MQKTNFKEALEELLEKDARYDEHAYYFIREALDYTIKMYDKPTEGTGRHVSGNELLQGIRRFTLEQFGPMSFTVLKKWGVHSTTDFGHIVFNLVRSGILGKTDDDTIEDFAEGYDFEDAFRKPFMPSKDLTSTKRITKPDIKNEK